MVSFNPDNATQKNINLRDADIFQRFYTQHYLDIFRFIYGLCGGPVEEVEDFTAETFVRAWKSRRKFKGTEQAAQGWLFKIARNLVIDNYRQQKKQGFSQDIEQFIIPASTPSPEAQAQIKEQVQIIWSLLPTLPPQQREILILRYLLGWRVNQIGEYLDLKENTVSVYIRRALKQLRQSWPGIKNDE